tara:strand:+ start:318 stop:539 length:222 start_codon:yes stop_codon:yes gene_type:complete
METKVCPKCEATWIGGQHFWTGTGKMGNELDLAGLVCNKYGDETCINPCIGMEGRSNMGREEVNFAKSYARKK